MCTFIPWIVVKDQRFRISGFLGLKKLWDSTVLLMCFIYFVVPPMYLLWFCVNWTVNNWIASGCFQVLCVNGWTNEFTGSDTVSSLVNLSNDVCNTILIVYIWISICLYLLKDSDFGKPFKFSVSIISTNTSHMDVFVWTNTQGTCTSDYKIYHPIPLTFRHMAALH